MAHTKSITFWDDENSAKVRFSEAIDGGLIVELPGDRGWEDAYETNVEAAEIQALLDFLMGGER